MIKRFIIAMVGLYVNVLERPSAAHPAWAVAKFDPPTTHMPHSPPLLPCYPKPEGLGWTKDILTTTTGSIIDS